MVRFGAQGLIGRVSSFSDAVLDGYVRVFLDTIGHGDILLVGHDHQHASVAIAERVFGIASAARVTPVNCGILPAPALAYAAMRNRTAAIMVTAPHQTEQVTGLRFFSPVSEISSYDEARISAAVARKKPGAGAAPVQLPVDTQALNDYIIRHTAFQTGWPLRCWRIGVFRNGSTAANALQKIVNLLGASFEVTGDAAPVMSSDLSDPDTVTLARLRKWQVTHKLDAVISTSPAGDRPFLLDNTGTRIPGDMLAAVAASELGVRQVVVQGTSHGIVDRLGTFEKVSRREVSAKQIRENVEALGVRGMQGVAGYDVSGGLVLGFDTIRGRSHLSRLICADGVLPIVGALMAASRAQSTLSTMFASKTSFQRASMSFPGYPWPVAKRLLREIDLAEASAALALGALARVETVDGLRLTFASGEVVHLVPSGTSAQLNIIVEAEGECSARAILRRCASWLDLPDLTGILSA